MCGIIGYVGDKNIIETLHKGLLNLEYRGYDSAGISYFENGSITTKKMAGSVENLFKNISDIDDKNVTNAPQSTQKIANQSKTLQNNQNNAKTYKNSTKTTKTNIGIGHTRWATHGKATDKNSHPHKSADGKVFVVHNGIIENYQQLKNQYLSSTVFESETDTEVVANLIAHFLKLTNNKLEAIFQTTKLLVGSYALAILFDDEKESIFFAKNLSPLLIGIAKSGTYISSDILGFDGNAEQFVDIENFEFGKITKSEIQIFDKNHKKVHYVAKTITNQQKTSNKNNFAHYMLKEINEIPSVMRNISNKYLSSLTFENLANKFIKTKNQFKTNTDNISPLLTIDNKFFDNISKIKFVACGTSFHASKFGELLFKQNKIDASSDVASEFIYSSQVFSKDTLYVFISQSGETADTLSAVALAKKHGLKTVAITNVETSNITKLCDHTLPLCCGTEIAVASTKAYNAQLCVIQIFCQYFKSIKNILKKSRNKSTKKQSKNIKKTNNFEKILQKMAKNIKKMAKKLEILTKNIKINFFDNQIKNTILDVVQAKKVLMVGKDFDYVLALESALKLKEISYISSEAYPSGELKHGTIALADDKTIMFAFITEKKLVSKTLNIANQVESRGTKVIYVTPFKEIIDNNQNNLVLPKIDESLYPIVAVIPMQLLAYRTSVALGNNPDKPRNLAKSVTVE